MNKAITTLCEFSADETMRIRAERREMFLMDQAARIQYSRMEGRTEGRTEGEAKGRAEGEAKGRAEVARRLLERKMAFADIADATGLSEAEVKRLAAE
jgi:predicted transposase/invertase (TIGR01784 family)